MFGYELCDVDNRPLVSTGKCDCGCDGPAMKCLNEQTTHEYHWPDKEVNSGWVKRNLF